MTAELAFPKIAGDIAYPSEYNLNFFRGWGVQMVGDGSDGALTVAAGTTTLTDTIKQYTSITVDAGATLAIGTVGKCMIFCQGDCTINGAITLPPRAGTIPTIYDGVASAAGAAPATVKATKLMVYLGLQSGKIFPAEPAIGADGIAGNGGVGIAGTGATTAKGMLYFIIGGALAMGASSSITGTGTIGGNGGNGGASTGGGGGGSGSGAGSCVMYVRETATLASGATVSMIGGAGGTGGTCTASAGGGYYGGSGGSGGCSYVSLGGAGGAGTNNQTYCNGGGGGGGGGGLFILICGGVLTNAATISVAGGAAGAATAPASAGSAGVVGLSIVKSMTYTTT